MSALKIVEKQIRAYNNGDIDEMMSCFSDDVVISNWHSPIESVYGYEKCKKMYSDLFLLSPKLRAEVLNTIILDDKIIIHELVSGKKGLHDKIKQVVIFEIANDRIMRMTSIR